MMRPKSPSGGSGVSTYDDDSLLTKKQLASALNTSERTIERWIAAGTAPATIRLPSGGLRWRWGTVRAWLVAKGDQPPGASDCSTSGS
jgi:predicted DNA-binding transcriptional regulator AlpA